MAYYRPRGGSTNSSSTSTSGSDYASTEDSVVPPAVLRPSSIHDATRDDMSRIITHATLPRWNRHYGQNAAWTDNFVRDPFGPPIYRTRNATVLANRIQYYRQGWAVPGAGLPRDHPVYRAYARRIQRMGRNYIARRMIPDLPPSANFQAFNALSDMDTRVQARAFRNEIAIGEGMADVQNLHNATIPSLGPTRLDSVPEGAADLVVSYLSPHAVRGAGIDTNGIFHAASDRYNAVRAAQERGVQPLFSDGRRWYDERSGRHWQDAWNAWRRSHMATRSMSAEEARQWRIQRYSGNNRYHQATRRWDAPRYGPDPRDRDGSEL